MVDRYFAYTGQIPLDTMILQPQRNTMIGLGALAQAIFGEQSASPAVAVDGFALAATNPASLVLNVGPGSIYAQGAVDQSNFGSLLADITDTITLQGITLATTQVTFTPPGTIGFSTNYLVQVALSVQDGLPIVLPYLNAANPTVPWLGPNNTGTAQNTVRQCVALIQAKAGIAASSGTQVTPAPDPGFFGLYSVTVANGATALTSGNWSTLPTAPFVPSTLMAMPASIQSNKWLFSQDTGTANALIATLNPPPTAILDGMKITVQKGAATNTGPSTLTVNGTLAPIHTLSGAALVGGEMQSGAMIDFAFDSASWQIQTANPANAGGPLFDGDATGTNTYIVSNLNPATSGLKNRMMIKVSFANPNTAASNLNIGFGANPIVFANGVGLSGGEITGQHILSYNLPTASWELLTPTVQATVPPTPYVHNGADTSTIVNQIAATVTPAITSYAPGHIYILNSVANSNTSGVVANFNGVGTRVVSRADGAALVTGDIKAGQSLTLVDNGTLLEVLNKVSPTGRFPTLQIFQTNGTYTPSIDAKKALVFVTGGGGGGGGGPATNSGGGAGGTAISLLATSSITVGAVTVGVGGAGATPGSNAGATGGTSSLDALVIASGGQGRFAGGPNGVGTVGQLLLAGGSGVPSDVMYTGGKGGDSFWGGGAIGGTGIPTPAGNGSLGGGGGGGVGVSQGGNGGNGVVVILEFS